MVSNVIQLQISLEWMSQQKQEYHQCYYQCYYYDLFLFFPLSTQKIFFTFVENLNGNGKYFVFENKYQEETPFVSACLTEGPNGLLGKKTEKIFLCFENCKKRARCVCFLSPFLQVESTQARLIARSDGGCPQLHTRRAGGDFQGHSVGATVRHNLEPPSFPDKISQ